jgi:hypothetical protein
MSAVGRSAATDLRCLREVRCTPESAQTGPGPSRPHNGSFVLGLHGAPLSSGLDIVRKTLGLHEFATVQTIAIDQAARLVSLFLRTRRENGSRRTGWSARLGGSNGGRPPWCDATARFIPILRRPRLRPRHRRSWAIALLLKSAGLRTAMTPRSGPTGRCLRRTNSPQSIPDALRRTSRRGD